MISGCLIFRVHVIFSGHGIFRGNGIFSGQGFFVVLVFCCDSGVFNGQCILVVFLVVMQTCKISYSFYTNYL